MPSYIELALHRVSSERNKTYQLSEVSGHGVAMQQAVPRVPIKIPFRFVQKLIHTYPSMHQSNLR